MVGIFGIVVKEDGSAALLSAVTIDELKIVMKAIPEALHKTALELRTGKPEPTN